MAGRNPIVVTLSLLALGACAVEAPAGPTMPVMPAAGKTLAQFQQDDASCRQFAGQQTGGASPAEAANRAAVGSAAIGTGLGAATGALIGAAAGNPLMGAAIGGGAGLLGGSAAGAGNATDSAGDLRQRYDIAYQQCMATYGNRTTINVPPPQTAYAAPAYATPAPVYAAPAPVYAYPPVVYAYPPPYPYPYYYGPWPGYYYPRPYYGRPYWGPSFGTTFIFGFHSGSGGSHHHHHW